jgi:hypothetical protein
MIFLDNQNLILILLCWIKLWFKINELNQMVSKEINLIINVYLDCDLNQWFKSIGVKRNQINKELHVLWK